ncbi:MAG: hypothetical protein ACK5WZ_08030, partial [Pseudobdellovibrionaceae bacterium]
NVGKKYRDKKEGIHHRIRERVSGIYCDLLKKIQQILLRDFVLQSCPNETLQWLRMRKYFLWLILFCIK